MIDKKYIYIAAFAAAVILIIIGCLMIRSEMAIGKLESRIAHAKTVAIGLEKQASDKEAEANAYREKLTYLEQNLDEINRIARRQNEEIDKFEDVVNGARDDVRRVRGIRAIAITADELCAKLAETGHPCGE